MRQDEDVGFGGVQVGLLWLGGVLLTAVFLILILYYAPPEVAATGQRWLGVWLGQFWGQFPLLVLGTLTAGLLAYFVPDGAWAGIWPRRWPLVWGATAVLAFIIPFGLLGNIPVAQVLQQKGMRANTAVAFLLASAILNPLTLLDSWLQLGATLTVGRLGLALLAAILAGLLFTRFDAALPHVTPPPLPPPATWRGQVWAGLAHGGGLLLLFGAYWVVASLLAVLLTAVIPESVWFSHPVGIVVWGFVTPPPVIWLGDTAVWLIRALPTPLALAYLTSHTLLPLAVALLHTRLWQPRPWLLLTLIPLTLALILAFIP
jgi:hypothetical protein